jgi:hypothetical protein
MTNMSSLDTNAVLNRLLILHHRSLPVYLSYAIPWLHRDNEAALEVLQSIAADHRALVDRLGELILDGNGVVAYGQFPLRYTALHDLSLDYLVQRLIEFENQFIPQISQCADQLRMSPAAQAVALEALGEAKAHRQSLEELTQRPAAVSS